jgi:uncharacterized repeat protein (TIGR01451 family)
MSHLSSQGTYVPGTGIWDVGALAAAASATLDITARVNSGTAGTTIPNTATITTFPLPDTNTGNNSANVNVVVLPPPSADLALSKSVDIPTPNEGTQVTFTVTLTNNGPGAASGIAVTDALPPGLTLVNATSSQGSYAGGVWSVGGLPNGGTATLTLLAQVDLGQAGNTLTNTATITAANELDPVAGNNSALASVTVAQLAADLGMSKTVDNPTPRENETIVYTITLTNNGPSSASNVQVTDAIPAGLTYISHIAAQGSYDGTNWAVGSLNSGAATQLQITATVNIGSGGATIPNTATITAATEFDPNNANNSASVNVVVTPPSDLQLFALCSDNPPVYRRWRVLNSNLYPIPFTWETVNGSQSGSETAPAAVGATPGEIIFTSATQPGTNNVRILVGGVAHDVTVSDSTPCVSVDLQVSKTVDNATPAEGQQVIFTVTVTNNGPDPATTILIADTLPAGLSLSGSSASQGSYDGTNWAVGSLAPTANATLTITAQVDVGTSGSTITNTANIPATAEYDPNGSNNTASVDITVG